MEIEEYYEEIGDYYFECTVENQAAQIWINRGMVQLHGFNQSAAIDCFHKAINKDGNAIIAYWGLSYAYGPHYNRLELNEADLKQALFFSQLALEKTLEKNKLKSWEKELIYALQTRYPAFVPTKEILYVYLRNFSNAMKLIYECYSDNIDIASFYTESVMILKAWKLWSKDGKPTEEALISRTVLEKCFNIKKTHPGICHLYVHLLELSPDYKQADFAGDILRTLVPAAGHLIHMPSHLDILNGRYRLAIETNEKSLLSDLKFQKYCGNREGFYNFYILHNYHIIMYCAMFLGDYAKALDNALAMIMQIDDVSFNALPHIFECLLSKYLHVYVRFGKWKEILDEKLPENPQKYPLKIAMLRYARGVAYAALEQIKEGESEYKLFLEASAKVPSNWMVVNNTAKDILNIAQKVLVGEIEYRKKNYEFAYENLREAVILNDNLVYCEPWDWAMPPRHALGALLLEQNYYEEAYEVYMKDLNLNPKNVWSLHGIIECSNKLNRTEGLEKFQTEYENARKESKIQIKASCYCRLNQYQKN